MKAVFHLILLVGVVSAAPISNSSSAEQPARLWETPEELKASLDWLNGALDELDGDLIPPEFVFFIRSLTVDDFDGITAGLVAWENTRAMVRDFKNLIIENRGIFNGSDAEIDAAGKDLERNGKFLNLNGARGEKVGMRIAMALAKFPDLKDRLFHVTRAYVFKLSIIRSWFNFPVYAMLRPLSGSSNALQTEYLVAETYPTFSNSTKAAFDIILPNFTTHVACRKNALEECENKKTWMEPSEATQEEVDAAIAECQAQSKPKCKKWTLGTSLVRNFFGF